MDLEPMDILAVIGASLCLFYIVLAFGYHHGYKRGYDAGMIHEADRQRRIEYAATSQRRRWLRRG